MYVVRSVAHLVRISSIVLFFSRDCDGGAGPEVDAAAPAVTGGAADGGAAVVPKLYVDDEVAAAPGAVAPVDCGA